MRVDLVVQLLTRLVLAVFHDFEKPAQWPYHSVHDVVLSPAIPAVG